MESNYGGYMGDFNVIEALATLAYQGRRTDSFHEQLLIALDILQAGDIAPDRMRGSWAGAMGHTQFMPTSFVAYAVDHDRNGRRDMWNDPVDGQPWGMEVVLPPDFPWQDAELDTVRTVGEWRALGVRAAKDSALPEDSTAASVIAPAGHRGPAFLILKNFRVIMRYNNATSYALAVAHLADRIGGDGPFLAAWPRNDTKLRIDDVKEMQRLLTARGHNTGGVDGIIGPMTRAAIRLSVERIAAAAEGRLNGETIRGRPRGSSSADAAPGHGRGTRPSPARSAPRPNPGYRRPSPPPGGRPLPAPACASPGRSGGTGYRPNGRDVRVRRHGAGSPW
jgi:membrane-bound lytic murein transglycosylase B